MKVFLLFLFFTLTVFGSELEEVKYLSLKKDELYTISVKNMESQKVFTFRWTLYTNDGLVLFHSFNKRVYQNVLYLNTKNQSFKIYLKTKGADFYETPYLLVKFEKFDFKKHKAEFKLFLSDKKGQMRLKYPKNK